MTRNEAWSKAYARQAQADLATWEKLRELADVPACHNLQFLQMACEKLTKAFLCVAGSDPDSLQSSHAYVARSLPLVLKQQFSLTNPLKAEWLFRHMRHISGEIELLAPADRRGGQRPDNCEYPWEDGEGRIHCPMDWAYTPSQLIEAPAGRTFLKLVRDAIDRLA